MTPSAFISYAREDDDHHQWVTDLATRLRVDGVETILDQWHAAPGDQLPTFMERAIRDNEFVLIICTPRYKQRSDNRMGGVGYEGDIMTAEVFTKANHRKFIPIHRRGTWQEAAPSWLLAKYRIDLTGDPYSEVQYQDLLLTLLRKRKDAPAVGARIAPPQQNERFASSPPEAKFEDIRILGVAVDDVTMPSLDGTRGSALYTVPFTLSRQPPPAWSELFVTNWDHPAKWDQMHRKGIARVQENKILLAGTTIEEVQRHHRDTLKLAVDAANNRYREIAQREADLAEEQRAREAAHRANIARRAKDIKFD